MTLSNGTITLRCPRGRGLSARFERRLLPAFKRRTDEVGRVLPELYLHGLAHGDFDLALRGLLGQGARSTRSRSCTSGSYVKAGLETSVDTSNPAIGGQGETGQRSGTLEPGCL